MVEKETDEDKAAVVVIEAVFSSFVSSSSVMAMGAGFAIALWGGGDGGDSEGVLPLVVMLVVICLLLIVLQKQRWFDRFASLQVVWRIVLDRHRGPSRAFC